MIRWIVLLATVFCIGCKSTYSEQNIQFEEVKATENESLWLENRVDNCDSSLVFMQNIIDLSPKTIKHGRIEDRVIGFVNIEVDNTLHLDSMQSPHLYYFDLNCLEELDLDSLLRMFGCNEIANILKQDTSENQLDLAFDVCIGKLRCFSISRYEEVDYTLNWHILVSSH